ncbi:MAG: phage portal protein, partial [Desulfovibrio sp.]|nr:phage portal protein [Desulfovibrio sp.]
AGGNVVRQGIEFDRIGRRVAYHFYKRHPGDHTEPQINGEHVRVPAASVLHIIDPVEAGQLRGFSRYAPVLVKLFILDQYDDAELDRKKVAAMFAGFVRRPASEDLDRENGVNEDLLPLEPGQLQILDDGEDITFSAPSDVGGNYEAFQYRTLLQVAAGLGLPYANLTSDMLKANYSNTRAALLEFRRRVEAFQHSVLVFQLCRPVWARWMDAAALSGALSLPEFEKNRAAMLACAWLPPRWDWVDPQKDIRAEASPCCNGICKPTCLFSSLCISIGYTEVMKMQNQTKVSQWGNSLAIRLPQALVSELAIERGVEVELHIENDGFRVTIPSMPKKFTLDELLAGVTPENVHHEFDWGKAQGKEVW